MVEEISLRTSFSPQSIVTFTDKSVKYLYAGSAVLDAYYGTSFANDKDIFVPSHPSRDESFFVAEGYHAVDIGNSLYGHGLSIVSKVVKIMNKKTGEYELDVVFVSVHDPAIPMKVFHAILENDFDIKICALAWDGDTLYRPKEENANLERKTSVVRIKKTRTDPLNLERAFARMNKYTYRGFTLNIILSD